MESSSKSLFYFSPAIRLAIFFVATGISMIVGGLLAFSIVSHLLHTDFAHIQAVLLDPQNAKMAQFANALASIIAFAVPSLVAAYFSGGVIRKNLGMIRISNTQQMVLVMALAIAGLLLSGALGDLTEKIPIPTNWKLAADNLEAQYKKALLAMTKMNSIVDLCIALLAVAVMPAIVEELYFRASLQKILIEWSGKPHVAIIITAIIFSAFHYSYFGFLSRMSLGIVLGYIYYFTKSIWLPMLMHFINNAVGITTLYFIRNDAARVEKVVESNLMYYWSIVAVVVVYILLKKLKSISNVTGLEKSI
jgi:hypothetical protein